MKLPTPISTTSRNMLFSHLRNKRRMVQIGKGVFARVYGRPGYRRVVKVGCDSDRYLKYLSIVGKRNPNPYFPTVYSIERRKHIRKSAGLPPWEDSYYVVEMEKLTKWGEVPRTIRDRLLNKIGCDISNPQVIESSRRWEKEAVKKLHELWARCDVIEDVHRANIMFRRVGRGWQLVYTDPVC